MDLNILLRLARHWWQVGNPPRPAIKTIAECIGKSVGTVQPRLKKLERDGLITIEDLMVRDGLPQCCERAMA